MKLSEWARQNKISYQTAWNWFKSGNLPVDAIQTKTGTILVKEDICSSNKEKIIVIYARVSSRDRKVSLNNQIEKCKMYCLSKGYQIHKIYKEIASGMNDNRKELLKMLNLKPDIIIVENKDRLTRFGFNYLKVLLSQRNCDIEVLNYQEDNTKDLMEDLISIITSFCCRLYGIRRGKKKAVEIKNGIEKSDS